MHRTSNAPTHPDCWGLFGGKIERGETPEMAVKREAQEELGINLRNVRLFKTYKQEDQYGKQIRHVFTGPLNFSLAELRANQNEGQNLNLFSLDDLNNIKISKNDLVIIKDVIKNKGIEDAKQAEAKEEAKEEKMEIRMTNQEIANMPEFQDW